MIKNQRALLGGTFLAALTLTGAGPYTAAPQAIAPSSAERAHKLELKGVPNFGRVAPTLYRGGQPSPASFAELQKLGIDIVVNFREGGEIERERRQAQALGLRFVSIPWSGLRTPTNQQLAEFLELLRANPEKKVFVHCQHGSDRTGVMVAAYRIAVQHWTSAQAIQEMKAFRYHAFWLPHLKRYVENLPQLLAADPNLRALQPAPAETPP